MMVISTNGAFGFISSYAVTFLVSSELIRSNTGYEELTYRLGTKVIQGVIFKSIVGAEEENAIY